jgi:hypothetical protein
MGAAGVRLDAVAGWHGRCSRVSQPRRWAADNARATSKAATIVASHNQTKVRTGVRAA